MKEEDGWDKGIAWEENVDRKKYIPKRKNEEKKIILWK